LPSTGTLEPGTTFSRSPVSSQPVTCHYSMSDISMLHIPTRKSLPDSDSIQGTNTTQLGVLTWFNVQLFHIFQKQFYLYKKSIRICPDSLLLGFPIRNRYTVICCGPDL
jgi:hypothetical protein